MLNQESLSALAHFVLFLPVLQALREHFPDVHLALAGYPHAMRLARETGWVDETHSLDDPRFARLFAVDAQLGEEDRQFFAGWSLVVHYLHDPEDTVRDNLETTGCCLMDREGISVD